MDVEESSSFHPPTADGSVPFRYPSWVLLDKIVHFVHHINAPTKKVKTSTGQEVEISIFLADPPSVSCFCIHSPQIRREGYTFLPRVVSSAENLVLLSFGFGPGIDSHIVEFFVCKAASGGNLSIEPVPYSPTGTKHSCHASIVPRDGGNFLVADLSPREGLLRHYDLHVFSSETNKWTSTYLQLPTPAGALSRDLPSQLDKVISLGGSMVGWVDLWHGIVFCDVLEKNPVLRFIPLPTTVFNLHREGKAQEVRDVTCCDGVISFIEIEHCLLKLSIANSKSFKMTQNLDTQDFILDKACLAHDDLEDKPELVPDGWKIRTMYKGIKWNYWKKRHSVHVDDIPEHSVLLPQLWNGGAMECTLRNLKTTGFPLFGAYSDNVVYLMSKVESDDKDSWIVGVDLEKKKVEVIKPYCAPSTSSFDPTVLPCAFSKYMNTTPRSSDELVAASFSQNSVLNNHLPFDDTIPVASSAQNGLPNNHLPLVDTVPDNVQITLNVDGYYGRWNGSGYGAHSGCGNYQQPSQLQPPNFPPMVQLMSSLTRSVASSAHYVVPNGHLPLGTTVPYDVQPQQITLNVNSYNRRWNGSGYGAHSGCGNYQQSSQLQPPRGENGADTVE